MKIKADAYAASLLELARAEGITEKIDHDFGLIAETVGGNLGLKETLKDAKIDASKKEAVIDEIFGGKVTDTAKNFLQFLAGMGRVDDLGVVAKELSLLIQAEEKKILADVTTAIPLDEAMTERLIKQLSAMTGKEVKIHARVDKAILGGIIVRMGGKLLDGSISSRLENLRSQMLSGETRG